MLHAEYIDGSAGRLFCVAHMPDEQAGSVPLPAVVVVPALVDEMNKVRATLTCIGTALRSHGIALVLPDLFGTGDSDGEFEEATWEQWRNDLSVTLEHSANLNLKVYALLCVRTGALLAADAIARHQLGPVDRTVLIQPTLRGDQFVSQLLRLRTVGRSINDGVTETEQELIARMHRGESVNVGGYELRRELIEPLSRCEFWKIASPALGSLTSIETTRVSSKLGTTVESREGLIYHRIVLQGDPVWASSEIVILPELVSHVVNKLRAGHPPGP